MFCFFKTRSFPKCGRSRHGNNCELPYFKVWPLLKPSSVHRFVVLYAVNTSVCGPSVRNNLTGMVYADDNNNEGKVYIL